MKICEIIKSKLWQKWRLRWWSRWKWAKKKSEEQSTVEDVNDDEDKCEWVGDVEQKETR